MKTCGNCSNRVRKVDTLSDAEIDKWATLEDVQNGMKKLGYDVAFGKWLRAVLAEDPDNWAILREQCKALKEMAQNYGSHLTVTGTPSVLEFIGELIDNQAFGVYGLLTSKITLMVNKGLRQKAIMKIIPDQPVSVGLDLRFIGGRRPIGTRDQVLRSHASTARHEYAHWLLIKQGTRSEHDALYDIWQETKGEIEANTAKQLAGKPVVEVRWFTAACFANYTELFAEAWAAFHSPLYVKGTLPRRLEAVVARISKRLRLKTQRRGECHDSVCKAGRPGKGDL